MNKIILAGAAATAIAAGVFFLNQGDDPAPAQAPLTQAPAKAPEQGAPIVTVTLPDALSPAAQMGQQAFGAVCADCHGQNAAGKEGFGPPLVHRIYEPSHHADMSFVLAVERGVQAHHWRFGNMPAQRGLTPADVAGIIAYVRELQQANGIN